MLTKMLYRRWHFEHNAWPRGADNDHMRVLVWAILYASQAEALRVCDVPDLPLAKLAERSPREVRALLQPLVGAPLIETNQLPDGGTFDRLEIADNEDGVSQRFAWGADAGTIDISYQHGRAELVAMHLAEFEEQRGTQIIDPCQGWPRDSLAEKAGLTLPKRAVSIRPARTLSIYRYDLANRWTARLRCAAAGAFGRCMELNVVFNGAGIAPVAGKRSNRTATIARRPLRSE